MYDTIIKFMNDSALKEKTGNWLLKSIEDNFKNTLIPLVPKWLETYHLTWMTIIWSVLVVAFFYLGLENNLYYWFVPLFVVLQYITDLLDGAVGRHRDTGLVKWGYYADHFLDFIFLCAVIFGYALVTGFGIWTFLLLAVVSAFMVHAFLLVSTNEEFPISLFGIGPTEGRVIFIISHLTLVYFGIDLLVNLLPYIVGSLSLFLLYAFLASQIKLWKLDMQIKHNNI
jgi:phosphatidylglycerophosphate synthase